MKIRKKLKDMITEKLTNHMIEVDIQKTFPNIGRWTSYDEEDIIAPLYKRTKVRFENGINPIIRMDWRGSFFYTDKKITSTSGRTIKEWFVGFISANNLVAGSVNHPAARGWKLENMTNIEFDKLTFMDIILHNKLKLCLKCKWTMENNIKHLVYQQSDNMYIRNGGFLDGGFEMEIDWTALMREEKLKSLGF